MLACDCHLILIKLPWTSITVKYIFSHHNTHPSECKKTDLQPTVCHSALGSSLLCFSSCVSHFFPLSDTPCYTWFPLISQWLRCCPAHLYCRDLVIIITVCAQLLCSGSEKAKHKEIELATGCFRKSVHLIHFCLWPEMMTNSVPLYLA